MAPRLEPRHPEGMDENSPGFQPWVCAPRTPSPEGMADDRWLNRPFGTDPHRYMHPGLKPWAILTRPYGTGAEQNAVVSSIPEVPLVFCANGCFPSRSLRSRRFGDKLSSPLHMKHETSEFTYP
jgi:hypothetical protein